MPGAAGAKQIRENHSSLGETNNSLAWRAFRNRRVETWVNGKGHLSARQSLNQDSIDACGIQAALSAPFPLLGRRGVVSLYRREPAKFTPDEKEEIQASLELVQLVVEKSQESLRLSEWQYALQSTARELKRLTTEQEILDYVVEKVQKVFRAETVAVFLLRGEHLKRKAEIGVPHDWFADESYQQGQGLTWQAFESSESPFVIANDVPANDTVVKEHLTKYKEALATHEVRHLLAVPLRTSTSVLGVLRLVNRLAAPGHLSEQGFNRNEAQVLVSLCSIVALALEVAQQLNRFTVLQNLVQKTSELQSEEAVVNALCAIACEAINGDQSGIVLFHEDGSVGRVVGQVAKARGGKKHEFEVKNSRTIRPIRLSDYPAVNQVIRSQKAVAVLDAHNDPMTKPVHELFRQYNIKSILLAPLIVDGKVIGTLGVDSLDDRRQFLQEELALCELIAAYGGRAIEQAARFSQAKSDGQLAERERLRSDVHDIRALLGSTVIVKLQLMQDALDAHRLAELRSMLADTLTVAGSINDSILHVMDDLQDSTLAEEGLRAAIENYIQRYWSQYPVQFESDLTCRLPAEIEGQLYRIAQEAIANACEHGVAQLPQGCVQVELRYDTVLCIVILCISDNGVGFAVEAERPQTLGLLTMKERAKRLKTQLEVQSVIGRGTTVRLAASTTIGLYDEEL